MALKQYGLIKSIKAPDISKADLKLILKNTENETIKQLAAEKLLKNPDIWNCIILCVRMNSSLN
ncbi:hypothetical protein LDL34_00265 [Lactobacillus delbrueckii subsp. lactis]|nr:hypothetical protein LL717_09075 [Lactobacillus delbrueckii subsp. lactis]ASW63033.1 hypothetical protein LDL34_00265 [Lactobacillus delbrueckii subsp. lactis]OOV03751.1 hypothetical protein LL034_02605 [Lactobacillus delbrueckii subsp. lactis]